MSQIRHSSLPTVLIATCAACVASPPPLPEVGPTPTASTTYAPVLPANLSVPTVTAEAEPRASAEVSARKAKDEPAPQPTTSPAVAPASLPPLPQGTVVLHVGDSMADALGKSLKRELTERGITNVLKYQEATYIPQWAGYSMGFPQLIAGHKPDLVIITLGGNEVAMPDPTERAANVKKMVKTVGDRPCLWIAAPLWPGAPHTGILDVIRDNCAPCRFVDTNAMIRLAVLGDKVHPTIKERRRWARFMIRWLQHNRKPDGARPWDFKEKLEPPPRIEEDSLNL